jgi:Domain of unknown function (DUF5666)
MKAIATETLGRIVLVVSTAILLGLPAFDALAHAQEPASPAGQTVPARRIGAIKSIDGNTIVLTQDSGADVNVIVQSSTHILRVAPGEKNLKNAAPIQLADLQVGDRILVGGTLPDSGALVASSIVVMKRSDLEGRHEQEEHDWQKRGLGGIVSAVDPTAAVVTISATGFGGKKTVTIHVSKDTVIRRYAPNSVKFEEAESSTLQEIHPGDQLRARGDRSPDGAELAAEEIVTGTFRNIAGIINSVDASAGTINVQDVLSKKPVEFKITGDSQLHTMPPELAQRIAIRLKSGADTASASATSGGPASPQSAPVERRGPGGGMRAGGGPDFQQMLSRMPAITLSDLHKGDAVMVVTTQGSPQVAAAAIVLLTGVEPLLRAAPNGSQAMMLTPWNLGGVPNGDAASQ